MNPKPAFPGARAARSFLCALFLAAAAAVSWHAPATAAQPPGAGKAPMSKVMAGQRLKAFGSCDPARALSLSPASITFPTAIPFGTTGCSLPARSFTVTNTGSLGVSIGTITAFNTLDTSTVSFPVSGACSNISLAPGQSCSGTVDFCSTPAAWAGVKPGILTVPSNTPAGTNSIALSGTVAAGPPVLTPSFSITPGSAYFYAEVGTPGALQEVFTITNGGTGPLSISSVTTTPPFTLTDGCGATLAAGASCPITVSYAIGSVVQYVTGFLTIAHNAPGSPSSVNLAGYTYAFPGLTLLTPPDTVTEPLYLNATAGQLVTQFAYLRNFSGATVDVTGINIAGAGDFSIVSDNCLGQSIPDGGECFVEIQFSAIDLVPYDFSTDQLVFEIDGTNTYFVDLYGYVDPYYYVSVDPAYFSFGDVAVGSQSACQDFEIRNYGSETFDAYVQGTPLGEFPSCAPAGAPVCATGGPTTLAPGSSCFVGHRFAPTVPGSSYYQIFVDDEYGNTVASSYLDGYGYEPGPVISVDSTYLFFGAHVVGTPAPTQTITVTNIGDAPLTIDTIGTSFAPFTVTPDAACTTPAILAPFASCTIAVDFLPVVVDFYFDGFTILSDSLYDTALGISLEGEGVAAPTPSADFLPMSVDFGNVPYDTTSASQTIFFANTGSGPMSISGVVASGDFAVSSDCPAILDANSCCRIVTTFHPLSAGLLTGDVEVSTDAAGSPHLIPVQGTGVPPPSLTAVPASVAFGDRIVGATSAPVRVVFTNTGITEVEIVSHAVTGDFAVAASTCTPLLLVPVGATCYLDLTFTPTVLGARAGAVALSFLGGVGNPKVVPLSGNGTPESFPAISVSADAVAFGDVVLGTASVREVLVTSTGTAPLSVTGVQTFGSFYSASTNCTTSQSPGSSCAVTVTCRPDALLPQDGDLYIFHDASGESRLVRLSCTGVEQPKPRIELSASSIAFGNQTLGTTSAGQTVTIRSVGGAPLAVTGVGTTQAFDGVSNCPASLAPGESCTATATFTPGRAGPQKGQLAIGSNDPDRPTVEVSLAGTGCRPFSVQAARRGMSLCGP